jgi:hypothetical protein
LGPVDPFLAVMEWLIVIVAPAMVVMMASVHDYAPREARAKSLAALSFMVLLAGITCSIHFVQLAVIRRIDSAALVSLSPIIPWPWRWPSVVFALDLLAWDLFFGLSMLLAAPVFGGDKLETAVRRTMRLSGVLCVTGLLGPALGDLRLQYLGILGYAGVFPIVCLLLNRLFARSDSVSGAAMEESQRRERGVTSA